MTPPRTFPLIETEGAPHSMGVQYGTQARELIQENLRIAYADLGNDREAVIEYCRPSLAATEAFAPHLCEEMAGIAEGARVAYEDVFFLNAHFDLLCSKTRMTEYHASFRKTEGKGEECWTYAVNSQVTGGGTYVGWNADDSKRYLPVAILLRGAPSDGRPPFMTWTYAGWLGRPGRNPWLGMSAGALFGTDVGDGVPYGVLSRRALECHTVEEAVDALVAPRRMAGMNYTLGDVGGHVAEVEVTHQSHRVVRPPGGWIVYTGISNDGGLAELPGRTLYGADDIRIDRFFEVRNAFEGGRGRFGEGELRGLQRSHGPGRLCNHNPDPNGGATLVSFICPLDTDLFRVAYANPCENPYVDYPVGQGVAGEEAPTSA